jgi:hypothetical protein
MRRVLLALGVVAVIVWLAFIAVTVLPAQDQQLSDDSCLQGPVGQCTPGQ